MAGVSLRISVEDADLQRVLAGLETAMEDMTEPMDAIGAGLDASMLDRFERETGPDGVPWTPSQRALLTGGQTLTDRGHLRGSLTHIPSRHSVEAGSNLVYAHPHQEGGKVGRNLAVELPARPFAGVDDGDLAMIHDEIHDWLGRGLP